VRESVCVCLCQREREREKESVCAWYLREWGGLDGSACVRKNYGTRERKQQLRISLSRTVVRHNRSKKLDRFINKFKVCKLNKTCYAFSN